MSNRKCGFVHIPLLGEEKEDRAWVCKKDAEFTCCDYGGAVCADHKCRCSRPLTAEQKEQSDG